MVTENKSLSDASTSFLRAARGGNLDKVLDYIKNGTDINTCNQNGLNALHLASKEGHGHIVSELLNRGANVDAVTKKGNSALHVASLAGQEEIVRLLVQAGANVNAQSQNGFTPLYMAAQENHDAVVRYLLANGANQSIATEDGFTPLAVALQQGHDKVVAVLLENDTRGKVRLPALHIAAKKDDCKSAVLLLQNDHKSDVTSKSGFTPLHIAAHYGNQNIASLLLDKGADINYMAKHHITPLHVAAKWGKANMVSLLCERGANQEAKTRDGLTPLHCGARSGHENVVDLLLEKGAFISAKTKNGLTPLHMAAQGDHVDAARILFYHKAPVDDVTVDYLTALHVAAHCGHVKVAKLLLDRHADPNSRALNGFTPLHIACKKNRIEVVELLLKYGASIEATTESGLTPLHVASFMGCMNIVIYLLQHDAKPNHATVRGETPLHLAARANQADIIRILLRNRAEVDARAREQQTPLHIAARLGNADIVMMLLQHGAAVDSTTKDLYTALHIAAKEGQDEVAQVLMEHGASLSAVTKKGFTPLHLAAKYGNMRVAKTLLAKDAPVDAQGKNGVTPLHVAAHYDHQNVALLLLEKGASVKATAKNGYTPLHIAAKKNQMDIATTLLEYGAETNCESKAGFTPLHLAAQEGHSDMATLLIEHMADVNPKAKNGLTPLHLCAQEDRVPVAAVLVKHGSEVGPETAAGYTPLHVASHFGQLNMVRFLLQHQAEVNPVTAAGYTPLHQAAQQGHTLIISLLLEHKAQPNAVTNSGQTALSIAQRLGYISVVESLKVVTETVITTTTTTVTEEKYKVVAPETMQETFLSDSEDEGAEDQPLGDSTYKYLTVDEMKSLGDDSMPMDVSRDEFFDRSHDFHTDWISPAPPVEETISPQKMKESYAQFTGSFAPDNVDISRSPVTAGPKLKWKSFLVSFMVDARGGAMRGCRHSGVRVIVPPRKAAQPMRITCRYLKKDKLLHPPPLMEGEAIASRILEMGPAQAKFLGPVIIEVPHFASVRGREREIVILRSDNGETWKEHTLEASEEAVQEVLNESFDGDELKQLEDLNTSRITRIVTTDFPQYFAIVSRLRQEVHAIGTEGGMVSSTVVPQVQAVFQPGALTKKIKVGLQAQPIPPELVAKLLGNRVAVSPIVTIEPRRRKFHKPITLTIPVPQAAAKGMINQYSGDAPTLRLLCSITGGTTRAQWEDVTGSTPLTFVNDCVSFTTTVSARFWLMDCRNVTEATAMATELYKEAIHVPFMAKFVVFAKRHDPLEGRVRVFCMTDDKEEKTLEQQEHFVEVAKSRDVEVLEGKPLYLEFAGNLLPVTKSGDQLNFNFYSFRENRMPFNMRVKDHTQEPMGRVAFMREKKLSRQDAPQPPICNLNIQLPADICPEADLSADSELLRQRLTPLTVRSIGRLVRPEIHRADIRITDIAHKLGKDWVALAPHLDIPESDIQLIQTEYPDDSAQQATVMLRLWMNSAGHDATGNTLARGLQAIEREDIVTACITDSVMVTDAMEAAMAKARLDQSGFDSLREELGPSRDTSFRPDLTLDDRDIMKEAESVEDVRVSEVQKVEPVFTPSADVDERKYAAEEKTVSLSVEPASRPGRPVAPIAPRDGPATGQVTVTELTSPVAEERHVAPVRLPHPEVAAAEHEHKRRSMVLRELGDALAEVERAQPPLERPGRLPTDGFAVEEPVMVSEKKGLRSPVTPAMIIPTAAVRIQAAPDGSKTTVMQQTSESLTDDGRVAQKSTTITTTSVGDTSEFAERLASEGALQKPEVAQDAEEKDYASPRAAPVHPIVKSTDPASSTVRDITSTYGRTTTTIVTRAVEQVTEVGGIQETLESYSDRRSFWEDVSRRSQDTDSQEGPTPRSKEEKPRRRDSQDSKDEDDTEPRSDPPSSGGDDGADGGGGGRGLINVAFLGEQEVDRIDSSLPRAPSPYEVPREDEAEDVSAADVATKRHLFEQEIQRETQAARRPLMTRRSRDDSSQATDDDEQPTLSMEEPVPPIIEKSELETDVEKVTREVGVVHEVTETEHVIQKQKQVSKVEEVTHTIEEHTVAPAREVEEAAHAIVEKRMRTDIVMEEMGQSLETQSPERKRLLTPEEEIARQHEPAPASAVVAESQPVDEEDPETYEAKEFCTEEYSETECAEEEEAERKMLAEDEKERRKMQEDEARSETHANILDEVDTKSFVSDTQNDILDATEEQAPESETLDYQEPRRSESDEEHVHREHRVSETEHKYICEHLDRIDDVDDDLEAEAAASPMDDAELRGVHQQALRSPQQELYTDEPSSSTDESSKRQDVDTSAANQSLQPPQLDLFAPSAPELEYVSPSEPTRSLPQSYRLPNEGHDSGFHGEEQGVSEMLTDDHTVSLSPEGHKDVNEASAASGTFASYVYKPSTEPEHLEHEEEHYEPEQMSQEIVLLKGSEPADGRNLLEKEKDLLKEGMELIGEEIHLLEETERRLEEEKEHIEEEMEHLTIEKKIVEDEKKHLEEIKERLDEEREHVHQEKGLVQGEKELISEDMEMMEEEIEMMSEQKELLEKEREYLSHEKEHVYEEKERIVEEKEYLAHMKDEIEYEKEHIQDEKEQLEQEKEHLEEERSRFREQKEHFAHELEEHDTSGGAEDKTFTSRRSLDMTVRVRPLDALSPETREAAASLPSPIHVSTETFAQPVWETALDHAELEDTEVVHDIPIERQTVLEQEETTSSSVRDCSVRERPTEDYDEETQANGSAPGMPQSMSFEDAQRLAVEIVSDIKTRLTEHPELMSGDETVAGTLTAVEAARTDTDARLQDSISSDKVTTDSSEMSRLSDEQPPMFLRDEPLLQPEIQTIVAGQEEAVKERKGEEAGQAESLPRPAPDSLFTTETHSKVDEYLRQLTEEGGHDNEHHTMVKHVVERKAADLSRRRHINLESLEITDEDLRESGNDLSPLESHMERLRQMSVVALDQSEFEELRGEGDPDASGHQATEVTEMVSVDGSVTERRQRVVSSGDFEEGTRERTIFTTTVVRLEEDEGRKHDVTAPEEPADQAEMETQTQRRSGEESPQPDVFETVPTEKPSSSVSFADEQLSKSATEFYHATSLSRESESTSTRSSDEKHELQSRSSEEASELISRSVEDTFERGTVETAEKLHTSITRSSEESFTKSTDERSEILTRSSGEASEAITRSTEETFEAAVKATDEATEKLIRTAGLLSRSAETRFADEKSETRSSSETSEAISRSTEQTFDISQKISDGKPERHLKTSADVSETFGRSLEEVSEEISRSTEETFDTSARSSDGKSDRVQRTSADVSEIFARSQQETSEAFTRSIEESYDSSSEDKSEKVKRVATEVAEAFTRSLEEESEKSSRTVEEIFETLPSTSEAAPETFIRTSTGSSEKFARSSSETSESRSMEETSDSWVRSSDLPAGIGSTTTSRLTEQTMSRSSDSRTESSLVSSRESVVTVVDRQHYSESPAHQEVAEAPSPSEKPAVVDVHLERPSETAGAPEPTSSPERSDDPSAERPRRERSSDEEQWPLRSTSFESGVVMRQRSASSRTDSELRRSAADSPSSGESRYQTAAEGLSDSSRATSRPASSEVELLGGTHTGTPSEYETALSATTGSSQDYYTAKTSLSWPGRSLDSSESSGHLASVEVSEPSETLMTSAVELDRESTPTGHPADEEDTKPIGHDEEDGDEAKTEGAALPPEESDESTPEEQDEARAEAEQFEGDDLFVEPNMKRSAEMVFGPAGHSADVIQGHVFGEKERDNDRVMSPEPAVESVSEPGEPTKVMQESIDSASETSRVTAAEQPSATESQRAAIKETWRTESERMDLSSASEQLSTMTCSLMSESCMSETLCQEEPSGPPPLPLPRDRILEQDDTGSQLSETDTEEAVETLRPSPPPVAAGPPAERVLRRALSESATSSAAGERLRAQLLEKGLSEERAEWEIQQIMTQPSDPSIAPSLERPDSPEPMADYPTRMPSETPVTPEQSPECRPSPQPSVAPTISITEVAETVNLEEEKEPDAEEEEVAPQQTSPPSDKSPTSSEKSSTSDEGREYVIDEPEFAPAIPARVHETIPEEEEGAEGHMHEVILEEEESVDGQKDDVASARAGATASAASSDLSPDEFILVEGGGRLDSIVSPPPTVTPLSRVRYFPEEVQKITEDATSPTDEHIDVTEQKRWAEQQFEGARGATASDFQAEELFTKQLEDIIEEEREEVLSNRELERLKESLSSTPELELVARGRLVSRSGESDDVSLSSLQEFERLELLMGQRGSQDSLGSSTNNNSGSGSGSGSGAARRNGSPRTGSSQGDDVSVNSLQEFEGLERQCQLAHQIETRAEQAERLLSEIEEGHESQMSESDSCETVSRASERPAEREEQLFEIDEIIRQAQSNVERLHAEDELMSESLRLEDIVDMTESSLVVDTPPGEQEDDSLGAQQAARQAAVDSPLRRRLLSEAAGPETSGSAASLERRLVLRPGTISAHSIETGKLMTDSVEELRQMTDSIEDRPVDQIATNAPPRQMTDSLEMSGAAGPSSELQGATAAAPGDVSSGSAAARELLLCSFDSVSSSQATHATYQYESDSLMSSSMASTMSATIMGSTETLEPDPDLDGTAAGATGGLSMTSHTFHTPARVSEGEWQSDEPGFERVRYRSVQLPGEAHQTTFTGTGATAAAEALAAEMQPGEDVVETQVTDDAGNVHVQRVVRRRVVLETGAQPVPPEELEAMLAGVAGEGQMEETEEIVDDGHGNIRRVVVRRQRVPVQETVTVTRTGGQTTSDGYGPHQTTSVTFSSPPVPHPASSALRRVARSDSEEVTRCGTAELLQGAERGGSSEAPQMFSEPVEGTSGQGPTLRRMVRTETRTQTTFDDQGRPVTRTITERITTEADGTETRQIVETED